MRLSDEPARRILIVVNPAAGRVRSAGARLRRIVAALERRGCVVSIRVAAQIGDAERLTRDAGSAFDVVAAAGGDGTVNAVANGLAAADGPALAVLPLGTANVLAREIGLPRRPDALAAIIATAPAQPIWPGRIGDRLFVMMAGAGFDADIVAAVDPALKRRFGRLAFVWAILVALCRGFGAPLTADLAGQQHRVAAVIAAKGRRYAGRFVLARAASLAEPKLSVVLFHHCGRMAALRYLAALVIGRVDRLRDVTIIATDRVTVTAAGPRSAQADGEIIARLPVTIDIAASPLRLIRPLPASRL